MNAVVKAQVLDDEGLTTLMCEVEAIVNGRPISKVLDDPKDMAMEALYTSSFAIAARRTNIAAWLLQKGRRLLPSKMMTSSVPCRRGLETICEGVPPALKREAEMVETSKLEISSSWSMKAHPEIRCLC